MVYLPSRVLCARGLTLFWTACGGVHSLQGKDYAGQDYNVTMWSTPANQSANHYQASALRCEVGADLFRFIGLKLGVATTAITLNHRAIGSMVYNPAT